MAILSSERASARAARSSSHMERFEAMGGLGEVCLEGHDPAILARAARIASAEVHRIEWTYSRYRPDSIVSRINAAAGSGQAMALDEETAALIEFGRQLHEASDGRFDLTSGVYRRAWNFRQPAVPNEATLAALRPLVDWSQVEWDGHRLALPRPGMEIDFGAIGKEYAADRAATLLLDLGVSSGWINLAGDLRVLGPRADGSAWRLGIQHPRDPQRTVATVALSSGALATSGDYERAFVLNGQRYCHLLDARTGWPVDHWQSVSIVAPLCTAAGALATLAMLMGDAALAVLRAQPVGYLAIDALGELHHRPSPGPSAVTSPTFSSPA